MTTQRTEALALAHLALTGVRLSTPGQNTLARDVLAARPSTPTVTTEQVREAYNAAKAVRPDIDFDPYDVVEAFDYQMPKVVAMLAALGIEVTPARTVVATPQDTTPSTEGDHG